MDSATQCLIIDGKEITTDFHKYELRWYLDRDIGWLPVLYYQGKRIGKEWRLVLEAHIEEDKWAKGNANCA